MKKLLTFMLLLLFPISVYASPREIDIYGEIDMPMAISVTKQLRDLEAASPGKPIVMIITSPGGSVIAGLQIIDVMNSLVSPITTRCEGWCASMAATILASGDHREAMPNAKILTHFLSTDCEGKLPEVLNCANISITLQNDLDAILAKQTGLSLEQVKAMESYDHMMTAEEALANGLIDKILYPVKQGSYN